MERLVALLGIAFMLMIPPFAAQASSDPVQLQRQEALLSQKRSEVQEQIRNAERRLHQLETNRNDKLEELGELCRARADLNSRRGFNKDIDNEIADQTSNLRHIEVQRSDCLEELDGLCQVFLQINRDIAKCDKELH